MAGKRRTENGKPEGGVCVSLFSSCSFYYSFVFANRHRHLWTWLCWRGKSKLPNKHPLEHCVKQWGIKGRFPCVSSTACCSSSTSTSNSTFPGLGFESQSRQFFVMWLQWQLILINQSINQSIKLFKQIFFIDWPLQKVGRRKKAKKRSWLGFEPQTWKCGIRNGTGTATAAHARPTLWRQTGKAPFDSLLLHSVPVGVH